MSANVRAHVEGGSAREILPFLSDFAPASRVFFFSSVSPDRLARQRTAAACSSRRIGGVAGLAKVLQVDPKVGLTSEEVVKSRLEHGDNATPDPPMKWFLTVSPRAPRRRL